ncbi:TonB-dependent receptor [Algivirga pacifica]|uniref:TonB-dependent receptor n=1 Tax=Algivirga pacifica TaxID=1162670 RepID=A0ABP9DGV3_9BACT
MKIYIKVITLSLLFIGVGIGSYAQKLTFTLTDVVDKAPLPYANICVEDTVNASTHYYTTDQKGTASLPWKVGRRYTLTYSGYQKKVVYPRQAGFIQVGMKADMKMLEEVLVTTGQGGPTPVDQSLYNIKVMGSKEFQTLGATTLADALHFTSNVQLSQDVALGTGVSMQGLSGENVKILIDGMPVVGRLDGNIDLSQLNLSEIAHIEILEGPLSVTYGSNALAGTINLITKTNKYHSWQATADTYAESIGKYSGNVSVKGMNGNHHMSVSTGYLHFNGFDEDKEVREVAWNPKSQWSFQPYYQWKNKGSDLKLGWNRFEEELRILGTPIGLSSNRRAMDNYFTTLRNTLYLQGNWKAGEAHKFNLQLSRNGYQRERMTYEVSLISNDKIALEEGATSDQFVNYNNRFSYLFNQENWGLTLGIDHNYDAGIGDKLAQDAMMNDLGIYMNGEVELTPSLGLQAGVRWMENSAYEAPMIYTLHGKWFVQNQWEAHFSYAKGFRAPSLKERFMDFVDSNHTIFGNENLGAETSQHVSGRLQRYIEIGASLVTLEASAFYNSIENVIDLLLIEGADSNNFYTYDNLDRKHTMGGDVFANYNYNNRLKLKAGVNYMMTGYKLAENDVLSTVPQTNFIANATWKSPFWDTDIKLDYKWNGAQRRLSVSSEDEITESWQDSFHILNASFHKSFLRNQLQCTLGVKNILGVTNIATSGYSGGAHSGGGSGAQVVATGRSVFITLQYRLSKI